jgi:TRAP transporter TAXI family solute receptor
MKKMLKYRMISLTAVCMCLLLASSVSAKTVRVKIAGSTGGGGLGPLSVGLFKIIKNHLPDIQVGPPQATGGSTENARLLGLKEVNFGYSAEIHEAATGVGVWAKRNEKYTNLRAVYTFPYGYQQFITLDSSGIRSFKDLKGKRICVGPAGSGGAVRAEHIVLPGLQSQLPTLCQRLRSTQGRSDRHDVYFHERPDACRGRVGSV